MHAPNVSSKRIVQRKKTKNIILNCFQGHIVFKIGNIFKQCWQVQMLAAGHMAGSIQIPGHAPAQAECPADLLEAEPALPKLNLMTARADLYPEIPGQLVRQWLPHPEFGEEMKKIMDKIHEEFGPLPQPENPHAPEKPENPVPPENAGTTPAGPTQGDAGGSARKRRGNGASQSAVKRAKVDRGKITPLAESQFGLFCRLWIWL